MAEIQIFNKQMRIYGNSLPGYLDATIDGGLLLKVVDDIFKDQKVRRNLELSPYPIMFYPFAMLLVSSSKELAALGDIPRLM